MLSAIFQVYQFYKSDKKLLGTIISRQNGLKYLQFSSLFSDLIILINTPKKVSKCKIPINITPLECFQLYIKSKKPFKVTKKLLGTIISTRKCRIYCQKRKFPGQKKFSKKIFFQKLKSQRFQGLKLFLGAQPLQQSNKIWGK